MGRDGARGQTAQGGGRAGRIEGRRPEARVSAAIRWLLIGLGLALAVAGCGGGSQPEVIQVTATPDPNQGAVVLVVTATPGVPIAEASTPTSAPPAAPALPTYPDVLGTYPQGTKTCCTDVQVSAVSAEGAWTLDGGKVCAGQSELTVAKGTTLSGDGAFFTSATWKCFGAKVTVAQPVTIEGRDYQPGTLLTVDKDGQWIEVSGWTAAAGPATAAAAAASTPTTAPVAAPPPQGTIVLQDGFDDNANGWPTGSRDNEWMSNEWQVGGGAYRWQAEAHDGVHWFVYPESPTFTDVIASVQGRQVSGQGNASWGLVFRLVDANNLYFVAVNHDGQYKLQYKLKGEWYTLRSWRGSPALRAGGTNKLTVLAQGSHLAVWINDQLAADLEDDHIKWGKVGLSIDMEKGAQAEFEFDEFELSEP